MIKRKISIFIFSMLTIISLIGQISASFSSLDITNEFQSGVVDIEIREKTKNSNNIPQIVMPHEEIYCCKTITNNGADCYVRVKLAFSSQEIGNGATISGICSDWIKKEDGYYYYTKVLKNSETIEVFNSIKLGDIDSDFQLSNFEIKVIADAVQSKHFDANFESTTPWGSVDVVKIDTNNSNITEYTPSPDETFKVIYKDDVKGMISNFDIFFNDVGALMPGDIYEDTLKLKNDTNDIQIIHFSASNTMNKTFLDKVKFEITNENGEVIFSGTLGENTEMTIATLNAKSSCEVKFKIDIPKELDNEFALNKSSVKWVFSTNHIENSPQTGDNSNVELYMFLMVGSIMGLIISIKGLKKHEQ